MSARFWASFSPANAILVPAAIALRIGDPRVQLVVGPVAAQALDGVGVGEARGGGDRAADHAPEIRADLGRAALVEVVAGRADLGVGLALLDVGLGQQFRQGRLPSARRAPRPRREPPPKSAGRSLASSGPRRENETGEGTEEPDEHDRPEQGHHAPVDIRDAHAGATSSAEVARRPERARPDER